MRIGIDYTSAAHQGAGIGRYTRGLVAALARLDRENEYRLFVAGGSGVHAQSSWPPNVRLRVVPVPQRHLTRIWHRLRLPLPIEAFVGKLEVFFSPDFVLPPAWGARTMLTIHDLSFVRYPQTADPSLRHYLNVAVPRSVRRAGRVLADSQSTAHDLAEIWAVPPSRISVLYPGLETRFRPPTNPADLARVKARYSLPEHFILAVGTVQPRKNYERLIDAFGRLHSRVEGNNHQLVVAGARGWLCESIFDALRESQLERQVRFLGFVPDQDLPALYALADLFVFPSLYEGFGLPVLEAMGCGTPVVCSDAASLPEVAGEAAILLDPLDVEGWAEAMEQMLRDSELRQEMVARGLARARRFSWDRSAREWLDLCMSLAA